MFLIHLNVILNDFFSGSVVSKKPAPFSQTLLHFFYFLFIYLFFAALRLDGDYGNGICHISSSNYCAQWTQIGLPRREVKYISPPFTTKMYVILFNWLSERVTVFNVVRVFLRGFVNRIDFCLTYIWGKCWAWLDGFWWRLSLYNYH